MFFSLKGGKYMTCQVGTFGFFCLAFELFRIILFSVEKNSRDPVEIPAFINQVAYEKNRTLSCGWLYLK